MRCLHEAAGRVLAEDICADRDLPPYDRVTMDGIAIQYDTFEKGIRTFQVKATMAAGDEPIEVEHGYQCIELMTGCALPASTDTVIRYEDIEINNGYVLVKIDTVRKGQNIHCKGKDTTEGEVVVLAGRVVDPPVISMAASVGISTLLVRKNPTVLIISTGDEVVGIDEQPTPWQVRQSNNHTIKSILQQHGITAEMMHIADDEVAIRKHIGEAVAKYDVLLLSGGISMGKYDYIPKALEEAGVTQLFHKVKQRPGKPFWFGAQGSRALVFAFPGNPVSVFMCMYRYFLPWLAANSKYQTPNTKPQIPEQYAILEHEITFAPELQYFMQVRLKGNRYGQLLATPMEGNGSGDFANLVHANAFMELPADQSTFMKGEVHRVWPFKPIV